MPIEKEALPDSINFISLHLPSFCGIIEELVIDLKDFFLNDLFFCYCKAKPVAIKLLPLELDAQADTNIEVRC
jgi:hypothetical protein